MNKLIVVRESNELKSQVSVLKKEGKTIGFVPTMGALHEGHLKLVEIAKSECDVVIVSIFVNPTQFNNSEDLNKYPRQEEEDLLLLEEKKVEIVFLPSVSEVYPEDYQELKIDLGFIGSTMEGEFRPGHFDGVVNVVSRLFNLTQPDKAYFGRKDFQQVAVIREMVKQTKSSVKIIAVEISRTPEGLARSSRNLRLTEQQLNDSLIIYETLIEGKKQSKFHSPFETKKLMENYFSKGMLEIEYLKIVDPLTLRELVQYWTPGATACIVAYSGDVRLIDNMEFVPK